MSNLCSLSVTVLDYEILVSNIHICGTLIKICCNRRYFMCDVRLQNGCYMYRRRKDKRFSSDWQQLRISQTRLAFDLFKYMILSCYCCYYLFKICWEPNVIICDCSSSERLINCLSTSLNFVLIFEVVSSVKMFVKDIRSGREQRNLNSAGSYT